MSNNIDFSTENIAIVQSQSSDCTEPSTLNGDQLTELNWTISLPVVQSKALTEDQFIDTKFLFGSWVEDGEEDKLLEELYKSRLIPSTLPDE